jgi:hypothetical protein
MGEEKGHRGAILQVAIQGSTGELTGGVSGRYRAGGHPRFIFRH